jgi:hypothetical protein
MVLAPAHGIRAINTTIAVVGLPCGTNNPGNIVFSSILSSNDIIATSFDDIAILFLPSATCWGEHDASNKPSTAIKTSVLY